MVKKSRFSMLEVNDETPEEIREEDLNIHKNKKLKKVREVKTIVSKEDFENNLKKHELKIQKKKIKEEKEKIKDEIDRVRKYAYIKILIGAGLTSIGLYRISIGRYYYQVNENRVGEGNLHVTNVKEELSKKDVANILFVVVGVFMILKFLRKKGVK